MSHSDTIDRPRAASFPSFRADHVGSLLRPQALREARAARAEGRLDAAGLRAVEDEQIARAIAKQEEVGLRAATDGEYRRAYWHYDFLGGLDGIEIYEPEDKVAFKGATLGHKLRVTGKIGWKPSMIEDFRYTASRTRTAIPKQTIPSPSVVHFRGGREAIDRSVYPHMDEFFGDLGATYEEAVGAFYAAGCRYLQLDEVNIAYLCDPQQIEGLKRRGEHVEGLLQIYADMINRATRARPKDMAMSMHLCRGNFQSTFIATGGYEPVAEVLFNAIDVDAYFMEFDDERSGGFEPLRFVPRGNKVVVLGIMTSKTGELESKDELKRRLDDASKFLPMEQLAISPQCGFASTQEGNKLSEEQQWAKLRLVAELSEELWGR
ncbi:5-methyltetrahydropteroyltriglutamate--homocysteine S-methyltransferase [Roseomonas indoligenes]|uniref:5-methyltetrahydropteroyltriglutamate--homocysteine S-methyltransferase n=1 Tax=Roseomonas indoligenes TaxID=2820811 RepID=A0A940MVV8_9PROT|nr:5-methyltetrahydropteroyltriglutamate--homocysteine S-methyltransferase [Pararoseomonas indoligenes]MBP0492653.1 5-methyltetrahydropteroyltriglutamate--homocysteine S-methyltransferase [Pararoseomonas indoligenes]